MATFRLTSEPAPSKLHPGHLYAYYDAPTTTGSKATLLLHPSLEGALHRGSIVDATCITYDDDLQHCVLHPSPPLQPEAEDNPLVPDEPPARWAVDDAPTPERAPIPRTWKTTPAGHQRLMISEEIISGRLPLDLLQKAELMCRTYTYIAKRIGVRESPRAAEAKSMAITLLINELRNADPASGDFEEALRQATR